MIFSALLYGFKCVLMVGAILLVLASAVPAAEALPQPVTNGGITFITGGIGSDERQALMRVESHYNLNITNSGTYRESVADTRIRIRNYKGEEIINTQAGPLFFVNVPAGEYTVEAASENQTKSRKVRVPDYGSARVDFSWNAT